MKLARFLCITAVLLMSLSVVPNVMAGSPITYLGKTTWTVHVDQSTVPQAAGQSFTMTGAVSKVGDEFYLFQGYVNDAVSGPYVVSGSGFLNGTTLVFTLSESQRHSGASRDSGVLHVELDKTTLNGTMYDIGHDYDTSQGTFADRYTTGTVTLSGGVITLSSASNVSTNLLLLDD